MCYMEELKLGGLMYFIESGRWTGRSKKLKIEYSKNKNGRSFWQSKKSTDLFASRICYISYVSFDKFFSMTVHVRDRPFSRSFIFNIIHFQSSFRIEAIKISLIQDDLKADGSKIQKWTVLKASLENPPQDRPLSLIRILLYDIMMTHLVQHIHQPMQQPN